MKFLVDNQLPSALAKLLVSRGHDASHVLDLGLDSATDTEIWNYANANSFVLITKDEDFSRRASQPSASVQVVWVRGVTVVKLLCYQLLIQYSHSSKPLSKLATT